MSVSFDREAYYRRIKRLFTGWQKGTDALNGRDVLIFCVGQSDDDQYSKSMSLQLWLFGYELSDTMVGLSKVTNKFKNIFKKN